jgi:hypothetical protein
MQAGRLVSKIGKGLLAANMAAVLRVAFHGSNTLPQRLNRAYRSIDPFDSGDPDCPAGIGYFHQIPEIQLHEVVDKFESVTLDGGYRFVDGALPWVDLVALLTVARARKPRTMLEIGTYFGYSTRSLALSLPDSVIHTIDLPVAFDAGEDKGPLPKDDFHLIKDRCVGKAFASDPSISNIVQHYGDTASWDFVLAGDAALFFIDGSHTYEYARNDTEKCLAVCKDRHATILWHDCNSGHPGVVRYLAELVQVGFPVKRISYTNMAILDC